MRGLIRGLDRAVVERGRPLTGHIVGRCVLPVGTAFFGETERRGARLLVAAGGVKPQTVLDDPAAEVSRELGVEQRLIAARHALCLELLREIVALELFVLSLSLVPAVELVTPRLHDHVHRDAWKGLIGRPADCHDLHFFERSKVGRDARVRGTLTGVDAVVEHGQLVVESVRPEIRPCDHAAEVVALARDDARRGRHELGKRPHGGDDLGDHLGRERDAGCRGRRIHHRALAAHRDALFDCADAQRHVHRRREAGRQQDLLAHKPLES